MGTQTNPEVAAQPNARRVTRRWPLISGVSALLLAIALGVVVAVRDNGMPLAIDTEWMDELVENRAPVWEVLSLLMNSLGGGIIASIIVPVLIGLALVLWKRPWAAAYYLLATLLTAAVVQLLKQLFGRARPEDILVSVDFGSFPSGHVANAATMAFTLAILFPRLWVWIAGAVYTVVMMISRTYLGAHWLSDTVGALLLGIGVAIVVWAPLASRIDGEREIARRDPASIPAHRLWQRMRLAGRTFHEKFIVESRSLDRVSRRQYYRLAAAMVGVGAVFFTLLLVSVLTDSGLTVLDPPVREFLEGMRGPVLTAVMIGLAVIFGPVALPIIVFVLILAWGFLGKHAWRPLLLAATMATGVILAQLIGRSVGRDRPPVEQMLFGPDTTFSFPSGHVLGASDFVLILAYLLVSRRPSVRATVIAIAVAVLCIVAAAVSRLYLGYHWTTDALASVALSLMIVGLAIALDTWRTVRRAERAERAELAMSD